MYKLFILCAMSLMLISTPQATEVGITSVANAVNDAGRQRMLTQRMTKLYAMLVIKLTGERRYLDADIRLFDKQLTDLKAFASNDDVKAKLAKVDVLWAPFKAILSAEPTKDGMQTLAQNNDALLAASHQVVGALVTTNTAASVVDMSGKQRMLSQRIAKNYMLIKLNMPVSSRDADIKAFETAMLTLKSVPENTVEIKQKLEDAQKAWDFAKGLFAFKATAGNIVDGALDEVLNKMNQATALYVAVFSK